MKDRFDEQVRELEIRWLANGRWEGITRPYTVEGVVRLRGFVELE